MIVYQRTGHNLGAGRRPLKSKSGVYMQAGNAQVDICRSDSSRPLTCVESPETTDVEVRLLQAGPSMRSRPLDEDHLARLLEAAGQWPPLLVHGPSWTVVDGLHRLEAARRLALDTVRATVVDCELNEARILAVRENVRHGLPLTLPERRRAAIDLLHTFPFWSDARLAEVCGLSRRTIGNLRLRTPDADDSGVQGPTTSTSRPSSASRIGRDGRSRPIELETVRERIMAALVENRGASLRSIAREVGVSPETVRKVRRRMGQTDSTPAEPSATLLRGQRANSRLELDLLLQGSSGSSLAARSPGPLLQDDSACSSTEEGKLFAAWFDAHQVDELDISAHVDAVPLSRLYTIVDESEHRAQTWKTFAQLLRNRLTQK